MLGLSLERNNERRGDEYEDHHKNDREPVRHAELLETDEAGVDAGTDYPVTDGRLPLVPPLV